MNNQQPVNIFIVEDNKLFMLALKADIELSFSKMPIRIHSFETGEACMKEFKNVKPHVVILDYHLNSNTAGAADGIAILDKMKKENPNTNVIMLTGDDNIDIAVKSFQHGASDYVVKTETKFKKINYSLFNIFKIMAAQSAAKRYKGWLIGFLFCIAVLIAGVIVVGIMDPSILK